MTNDRQQTLNEVRKILAITAISLFPGIAFRSPRTYKAALWAGPFLLVAMLFPAFPVAVGAILIALLVAIAVYFKTPAESWGDQVCKILTDYQPFDEEAYQTLLSRIKAGKADRTAIQSWLRSEALLVERSPAEADLLAKRLAS